MSAEPGKLPGQDAWVCPACHAAIDVEDAAAKCQTCGKLFPRLGRVIDFRAVTADGEGRWDAAEFDRAYSGADSGFEDGVEHALRAGIPEYAEKYRQDAKERPLMDLIAAASPRRTLDLGCGCGWLCCKLAAALPDGEFRGVDVSPFRVNVFKAEIAKSGLDARMDAAVANGEYLPFPEAAFDIVVMREVLEHLRDPAGAFREIARVLAPGGSLVITTPTRMMTNFWKLAALPPTLLKRLARGERLFRPDDSGVYDSPLSTRAIHQAAAANGMAVDFWRRVIFLPHESYLQFIPGWILKPLVAAAYVVEGIPPLRVLGLHHVIRLKKTKPAQPEPKSIPTPIPIPTPTTD